MDFTEYKDIWVFIETDGGKAASVGLELLNPAAQLAHKTGQQAVAVILGKDNAAAEQEAAAYGADKILSVEDPAYEHYTTDAFAYGMVKLVEQYKPSILMIGATIIGRDFGPRVSCRVKTGLTADCTSLDIDENGVMGWTRPAFGGNLMATIMCENTRPQMGTIRPGVFKKAAPQEGAAPEVVKVSIPVPADTIRTKLVESISEVAAEMIKLEDAEIIVSGGRGVAGPEGFENYIKPLADALGGAVGASRAAVDSPRSPGRPDRQDGRAQAVHRLRHLRCHPASGWHERLRLHRGHQQGSRCTYLQHCRLRHRGRPVPGPAHHDPGNQKAEGGIIPLQPRANLLRTILSELLLLLYYRT